VDSERTSLIMLSQLSESARQGCIMVGRCSSTSPSIVCLHPILHPQPAPQAGGHGRCPLGHGLYRFAFSSSSPTTVTSLRCRPRANTWTCWLQHEQRHMVVPCSRAINSCKASHNFRSFRDLTMHLHDAASTKACYFHGSLSPYPSIALFGVRPSKPMFLRPVAQRTLRLTRGAPAKHSAI
jgi:hypothetical protein